MSFFSPMCLSTYIDWKVYMSTSVFMCVVLSHLIYRMDSVHCMLPVNRAIQR